nr:cupredoxin family copper-binding protein [Streptomyces scabichelini]
MLVLLLGVPGSSAAATYRVAMKGYAYGPAALTVPVGSTVTWTNQDTAPHDVKTTSGPVSIHSPMLNKGQSWSFTFTTPGSYGYYCTVHPDMTARIVVRAAATSAAPSHAHSGAAGRHETDSGQRPAPSPRVPSTRPVTKSPSPAKSAPPSASPTSSAAAAVPAAPQSVEPASSARPLNGLLVLTGVVAGVAVLCLLLVGSRSAR